MFAASKDLGIIRATVLRLDRGIDNGEHFVLEDATGRSFPIHFKTIISWDSFEFILADQSKGRKGERRTRRKLYSLYESNSRLEIDQSVAFGDAFVPYQKVNMSLVCKTLEPVTPNRATDSSSCPWCRTVSPGEPGTWVLCLKCKRDFRRIFIDTDSPRSSPSRTTVREDKTQQQSHKDSKVPVTDFDSESEKNVSGLAHITLQTKRNTILQVQMMLKELRLACMTFRDISNEIYANLGVRVSPNALVKRYRKLQDLNSQVSPWIQWR